jgi:hypothetical protein
MVQQGQTIELMRRGLVASGYGPTATAAVDAAASVFSVAGLHLSRTRARRSGASSSGFDGSGGSRAGSRSLSSWRRTWRSMTSSR